VIRHLLPCPLAQRRPPPIRPTGGKASKSETVEEAIARIEAMSGFGVQPTQREDDVKAAVRAVLEGDKTRAMGLELLQKSLAAHDCGTITYGQFGRHVKHVQDSCNVEGQYNYDVVKCEKGPATTYTQFQYMKAIALRVVKTQGLKSIDQKKLREAIMAETEKHQGLGVYLELEQLNYFVKELKKHFGLKTKRAHKQSRIQFEARSCPRNGVTQEGMCANIAHIPPELTFNDFCGKGVLLKFVKGELRLYMPSLKEPVIDSSGAATGIPANFKIVGLMNAVGRVMPPVLVIHIDEKVLPATCLRTLVLNLPPLGQPVTVLFTSAKLAGPEVTRHVFLTYVFPRIEQVRREYDLRRCEEGA
jgi:hypothetical protein